MSKIKVDYSDRPNKSLVRYRIFNIIEEVFHPLYDVDSNISYITFSGYRFIDSVEFYRRFNNRNIYSIEYKPDLYKRACFNRPYEFIEIIQGRVSDFIDERYQDISTSNKVIFLDYEWLFRDAIITDLEVLFSVGFFDDESLLFITFNRNFKREKLTSVVKEILPEDIKNKDAYENWLKEYFSHFILNKVQEKYSTRKSLYEKLKVFYKDTAKMAIFGYLIKDRENESPPIVTTEFEEFALPDLTFLEENYLQNHLTDEASDIASNLGLSEEDIENYRKYI